MKSALFPSLCKGHYPPESSAVHFFSLDSVLGYYVHTVFTRNVPIPFPMTHILLKSHWLPVTSELQNLWRIFLQLCIESKKTASPVILLALQWGPFPNWACSVQVSGTVIIKRGAKGNGAPSLELNRYQVQCSWQEPRHVCSVPLGGSSCSQVGLVDGFQPRSCEICYLVRPCWGTGANCRAVAQLKVIALAQPQLVIATWKWRAGFAKAFDFLRRGRYLTFYEKYPYFWMLAIIRIFF